MMYAESSKERLFVPILRKMTHRRVRYVCLFILFIFIVSLFVIKQKKITRLEMSIPNEQKVLHYIDIESDKALSYENRIEQNKYFASLKPTLPLKPIKMTLQTTVFLYKRENHTDDSNEGMDRIRNYSSEREINESYNRQKFFVIKRAIIRKDTNTQEDTISMRLRHPNLLTTYKTFRTEFIDRNNEQQDIVWLYSQFLKHRISHKYVAMDENIIRNILIDVLHGLEYMHERKIMHLDIKIANIMGQTENNRIVYKLIDFGYARDLMLSDKGSKMEEIKIPSKSYGTFPYKPPEVVFENVHGLKSDIWCVGAVAWFLSLGRVPFYHDNGEKNTVTYRRFIKGTKKHFFYPETSNELRDFVLVSMNRRRANRPSVKELLKHPFILGTKFDESESESEHDSGYESDSDAESYKDNNL